MKTFKQLASQLSEDMGGYPVDEMTQKELKIAIYTAKEILEMLDDGATMHRWQLSAIVKASNELSSVYLSMEADEEDDEDYGYAGMYGEEVELDEATITAAALKDIESAGTLDKMKEKAIALISSSKTDPRKKVALVQDIKTSKTATYLLKILWNTLLSGEKLGSISDRAIKMRSDK